MLFKYTVAKRPFMLVVAILILAAVSRVARAGAVLLADRPELAIGLGLVSYVAILTAVLLGAWAVWSVLGRIFRWIASDLLATEQIQVDKPEPGEAEPVRAVVDQIESAINRLEKDEKAAGLLIADILEKSTAMVGLIKAVSNKARQMDRDLAAVDNLLAAIYSRDTGQIARAAGQIRDPHYRDLVNVAEADDQYWLDLSRALNQQAGVMERWRDGYRLFTSRMLTDFAGAKARLADIEAGRELVGVARPMFMIQQNLAQAAELLDVRSRPVFGSAGEVLPSVQLAQDHLLGG